MEGQYRFDFEIDSSEVSASCLDGLWSQVPEQRWCCDTLDPIEGRASVRHCFNNSQESVDYLVLWCDQLNTGDPFSYSFRLRHAYDPSSMNNWQFVAGASFTDGQGTALGEPHIQEGLVLGVNFTGSDDHIKIWHVDHARLEVLLSTDLNYQEMVGTWRAPLFRMEGDGAGNLDLYYQLDPAAALLFLGSCEIGHLSWGRQVVVRYRYTSARDQALCLDRMEFSGNFEKDTVAPQVCRVQLSDEGFIQVEFSEQVVLSEASSFLLLSEAAPWGVEPDSIREVENGISLSFPGVIPNRVPYELWLEGLVDLDGNILKDTFVSILRNEASWGDLVFNELMFDPDPPVHHAEEYLELFRRSSYPAELVGWTVKVNERSYVLDESRIESQEGSDYILLKGITLPNDGAVLSLYSKEGILIHAVSYDIPWDEPRWKTEGGWSLEAPDAHQLCQISASWRYSKDVGGGTPGRINSQQSILVDREAPVLLYAGLGEPGELLLHYNEPLQFSGEVPALIHLEPGAIVPDSVRLMDPLREVLQCFFPAHCLDRSLFQLHLSGISDCAARLAPDHVISAGAVSTPAPGSVLINEIMYDPEEGKPAYVELFHAGDSIIDLQDLAIHLVDEGGYPDRPLVLSFHSRLFLPGQFLVLTDCVPHLEQAYGLDVSGQWVALEGLSGLKSSSGIIYLTDRAGNVLDYASYRDEMHMELLDDPGGISLERISMMQPGSDPANWHSAASTAGYATPGRENSQSVRAGDPDLLLEVQPEVFSPDNDAHEDLLQIIVSTNGNDWIIGLVITDLFGNIIRVLANNHLAGPSVSYTWDGEGEYGAMQPMGFYVVHARGYRPATGEQWIRRKAVGLVYR